MDCSLIYILFPAHCDMHMYFQMFSEEIAANTNLNFKLIQ